MTQAPNDPFSGAQPILRPNADSFVLLRSVMALGSLLLFVLTALISFSQAPGFSAVVVLYAFGGLLVLGALIYSWFNVECNKEQYAFLNDRLVVKGGGLFSDFERELAIHNVTQVTLILPFIENKLFATGSIKVESAGAAETEVHIRSVQEPEAVYEKVLALLKQNGFRLSREKLIQKERPHSLAVFFEVFRNFFIGLVFLVLFVTSFMEDDFDLPGFIAKHGTLVFAAAGLALAGLFVYSYINFLDLKRRVYNLYADAVEYKEGFLNKARSVIPMENLADSSITQSFISKFFGLYDIKLSCQGAAQEILFKNIKNGEQLSRNIDQVIAEFKPFKKKEEPSPAMGGLRPVLSKPACDRAFTGEFKMNGLRVWMPFILSLPLWIIAFPVGIVVALAIGIRCAKTQYRIKPDSAQKDFSFMSRAAQEFSFDKITGILIKKSILDRLLNTATVLFWSIGSDKNIDFTAVKFDPAFKDAVLSKKGIRPQEKLWSLESRCDPVALVLRNLYVHVFFFLPAFLAAVYFLGAAGATVFLFLYVLFAAYKILYYKQSRLDLYQDYVHFSEGLINRADYYVVYDDVKDITTVRYPAAKKGQVLFSVAGETMSPLYRHCRKTQPGLKQKGLLRSNGFTIAFVDHIDVLDEMIDKIFYERPGRQAVGQMMERPVDTSHEAVYSTRPMMANYLVGAAVPLLLIDGVYVGMIYVLQASAGQMFPPEAVALLLTFNVLVIAMAVIYIRSICYRIQSYRVLKRSGVIFKKQTSVTFNNIDFINIRQDALNKIFGNGNVTVNTVGSSKPELNINYIKDFRQFYEILKKNYQ